MADWIELPPDFRQLEHRTAQSLSFQHPRKSRWCVTPLCEDARVYQRRTVPVESLAGLQLTLCIRLSSKRMVGNCQADVTIILVQWGRGPACSRVATMVSATALCCDA